MRVPLIGAAQINLCGPDDNLRILIQRLRGLGAVPIGLSPYGVRSML